jgi:hypothetical protein
LTTEATSSGYTEGMDTGRLRSWAEWYRFARETLRYEKAEATHYANLRYVEERNRSSRSDASASA